MSISENELDRAVLSAYKWGLHDALRGAELIECGRCAPGARRFDALLPLHDCGGDGEGE